jgi:hypothetical protein
MHGKERESLQDIKGVKQKLLNELSDNKRLNWLLIHATDQIRRKSMDARLPAKSHRGGHLFTEQLESPMDSCRPIHCQPPQECTTYRDQFGAQGDGFNDVRATGKSAINDDFRATIYGLHNFR